MTERTPSVTAAATLALLLHAYVVDPARAELQGLGGQQITPPPRDAAVAEERRGTATLRGRVVAADTSRPLRRARVTVVAPELGSAGSRTTSTGLDGRYEFKELRGALRSLRLPRGLSSSQLWATKARRTRPAGASDGRPEPRQSRFRPAAHERDQRTCHGRERRAD
jgi:hypothetical protein